MGSARWVRIAFSITLLVLLGCGVLTLVAVLFELA